MSYKFEVRVPESELDSVTYLGVSRGMTWTLSPILTCNSRCVGVEIIRSSNIGMAEIDVDLCYLDKKLVFSAVKFSQGQFCKRLLFNETIIVRPDVPSFAPNPMLIGLITMQEISMFPKVAKSSTKDKPPTSQQLSDDFLSLWNKPCSFSDAILKCRDAEIPVHRVIMSARSPVFDAMFQSEMQEGAEGIVNITDIEPDVLQAMLRYMYSGRTDHLTDSNVGDMLFAADKYQLQELKSVCVDRLISTLKADNCFGALVLGHLHDESLKESAAEFICKWRKFSELEHTEEWKTLVTEHPSLAIEVLTTAVKRGELDRLSRVGDK